MKFIEQVGADPTVFSQAERPETDAEKAARLRALSVTALNPFIEPDFTKRASRKPRRKREVVAEGTLDEPAEDDPLVKELGWEILPIGEGDPRGPVVGESESRAPVEDKPENIRRLDRLAQRWGENGYRAISKIETPDGRYEVAVRKRTILTRLGQLAVEDAVADTAQGANALYVWRAEDGLEDGEIVRTWTEVLSGPKSEAVAKGAKRFYHHGENIEERVVWWLDAKMSELD